MNKIIWAPSALNDLRKIHEYIARDSLSYANKFTDGAFDATERLSIFPQSGRVVPEIGNPSIREVGYNSYRIIYELIDDKVNVVAVIHGRRLLPDNII
jgi:plasmid stabilization system protein ParE